MPVRLRSSGADAQDGSSGVRDIVAVPTSITAFVGAAPRGPIDEPITVSSFSEYQRVFGGLWKLSRLGFAVRDFFVNGGGTAVIIRVFRLREEPAHRNTAVVAQGSLEVVAASPGTWGNELGIRVDYESEDPPSTTVFNLTVFDRGTGLLEKHCNVSTDQDDPAYVTRVLERDSVLIRLGAVGSIKPPAHKTDPDSGTSVWDDQSPATSSGVAVGAGEAEEPLDLDPDSYVGGTTAAEKKGMYALDKADLYNLLVIPPPNDGDLDRADIIPAASAYCDLRRAVLLLDAPRGWSSVSAARTGIATGVGTISKNVALYFPLLSQPNPLNDDAIETFSPGGAVAGAIARTDARLGVWRAPAGLDAVLNGVPSLTVALTDDDIEQLNPLGVNCLRAIPGVGRVIWGERTLPGPDGVTDEWNYLSVRRTALFIEESLLRGTQWAVFEPNDEMLWARIRRTARAFMEDLFRQGAFQGAKSTDSYFVNCDRETTTEADVDRGVVNIQVGFAPLKAAEFVVMLIEQLCGPPAA